MRHTIAAVLSLIALYAHPAAAQPAERISLLSAIAPLTAFEPEEQGSRPALPFGSSGTRHMVFGAMVSPNFKGDVDANVHAQYTYFIVDDFEVGAEVGLWGFFQDDDAAGVSASLVMRYHFFQAPRWSAFAEVGMGVLFTSDDVPDGGTDFNLMPRLGAGVTWRMFDDSPTRLVTGLRWHHISNARIKGEQDNPARDGPGLYAGLMYEF